MVSAGTVLVRGELAALPESRVAVLGQCEPPRSGARLGHNSVRFLTAASL